MTGAKGKIIRIVVSFAAIFGIVYFMRGKITESLSILRHDTQWGWFFVAVGIQFIGLAVIAVRLKWVFRVQEVFIKFKEAYYLGFVGLFYNLFLPSAVGGDIARIFYASKHTGKKIESVSSILLDRLMGLIAMLVIAVVGMFYFKKEMDNPYIDYAVYGALSFLLLCVAFFASRRFSRFLLVWMKFVPGKKWKEKVVEIHQAVYGYRHHHWSVFMALFLSFVGQGLFILMHFLLAVSLGAEISFWKFFILIPVVAIVSMAPSIGGLGVREAGVLYLFSRYLSPERALAFTLLVDIIIYGFSIGSGIVYAFRGGLKQQDMQEIEKMESQIE